MVQEKMFNKDLCSRISAFVIHILESTISKLAASEISVF